MGRQRGRDDGRGTGVAVGDVRDDVEDGTVQRMAWEARSVPREKIVAFIESIGLNAGDVRSVMMRPDVVEIEECVKDCDGRSQLHPHVDNTLWTRIRVFHID